MNALVFFALSLSFIGYSSAASYCICRDGLSQSALQKTIDYACGEGADCHPILQNGPCFQPNTVKAHCDYAANSYFQNKNQAPGTCDFSQTAIISSSLPSTVIAGCTYPTGPGQSISTGGTGTGGTTTIGTPGSTSGSYGLAPTGFSDSNPNGGSSLLQQYRGSFFSLTQVLLFSGLLALWG